MVLSKKAVRTFSFFGQHCRLLKTSPTSIITPFTAFNAFVRCHRSARSEHMLFVQILKTTWIASHSLDVRESQKRQRNEVQELNNLTTQTVVQSFLGLRNVFRRLIPSILQVAALSIKFRVIPTNGVHTIKNETDNAGKLLKKGLPNSQVFARPLR